MSTARFKPGDLVLRAPNLKDVPLIRELHEGFSNVAGMFDSGVVIANGGRGNTSRERGNGDDWIFVLDSGSQAIGWVLAYEIRRFE